MTDWRDGIVYLGGSEAAEARIIDDLSNLVRTQVREIELHTGQKRKRPQHAKTLATTTQARFLVASDLADDMRVGFLVPGASYPTTLRFSNAGALVVGDRESDLRGFAAKVHVTDAVVHDFLCTNAEIHHAKNAYEAMWASYCLYRPGLASKLSGIGALVARVGLKSALRIIRTLSGQIKRPVVSLATETFWSRSPYRFGAVVGRYRIRSVLPPQVLAPPHDSLGEELSARSGNDAIEYALELQRYVDEATTPLEDSTIAWTTPFEMIGRFVIDRGTRLLDLDGVETVSFSPWNVGGAEFEPIGNMNRARRMVYKASQHARAS